MRGLCAHLHWNCLGEDQPCPADAHRSAGGDSLCPQPMAPPQPPEGMPAFVFHITFSSTVLVIGNVKVLSMTSGGAPEQHHAASYFWILFRTHAHLDPVSEGVGAAI